MSHQIHYDENSGQQQSPPYPGYGGSYQDPYIASSGQKLSMQDFGRGGSAGQRLALAIVSVVSLLGATAIIFGNPSIVVTPFLLIAFGLICITIIAVNAIFNNSR